MDKKDLHMTETGKVFLRYLYKRFGWKVIHHRKKLFRIIHKRAFETSMKKLKFVIFTNAPCKGLNSNLKGYCSLRSQQQLKSSVIWQHPKCKQCYCNNYSKYYEIPNCSLGFFHFRNVQFFLWNYK